MALAAAAMLLAAAATANAISYRKWEAGTCIESSCKDAGPPSQFYTQAAGHPDFGITDFEFNYEEAGLPPSKVPDGHVLNVRVDLPAGLGVNPEATEQCTDAQLLAIPVQCPAGSQVGEDEAVGTASVFKLVGSGATTVTEHFKVFNMVRKAGQPARFGVKIDSAQLDLLASVPLGKDLRSVAFLEGGISWHAEPTTAENEGVATGDYHEFFRIPNLPKEPEIVESRLIFWGRPHEHNAAAANNAFITLPSTCSSKPVTYIHVDSYEEPGTWVFAENATPVTATGCTTLPFSPSFGVSPGSSQSDAPDGAAMNLHIPQFINEPTRTSSPEVNSTTITLPEGMTLNPSAAHGLEACASVNGPCPAGSKIGTFSVNAPGIPPGALNGNVYVGEPEKGASPESGGMYRIFLIGETAQYGVGLRLEGRVSANQQTGRLTATFANTPEVPFEDISVQFNGGPRAVLANPLGCGAVAASVSVTPYGGEPATAAASPPFGIGGCAAPLPFALSLTAPAGSPALAGAYAPYDFTLTRNDGQQYVQRISTTLPPGVLGAIPAVPLCTEPAASAGTCPTASKIGTVSVTAGSGPEPYAFSGNAYLTTSYNGAPYGLSVVVPALAGPYNLGNVVTRAALTVGVYDGRVTATSTLPTVVGGVPLRLKSLNVNVNRPNWIFNPTSCSPLSTGTTLTSTLGVSPAPFFSPFQVGGCDKLHFAPSFTFIAGGHPSKAKGTSFEAIVTQSPHEADIHQVLVQLPPRLPSRLTTIQKACPAANFEKGGPPGICAPTSNVGTATVVTPVLPAPLSGPAYLVSHGGEAFPDLDVILRGNGVEVILVGHTNISSTGITTSKFETLPDVPFSSFVLTLPAGSNSVLTANGRLCGSRLFAPATIVAHSGARLTPKLPVLLAGCGLQILSHRISHGKLLLSVLAPEAGTVTVSAKQLRTARKRTSKAAVLKFVVPLNRRGRAALLARRRATFAVRVGFASATTHKRSAVSFKQRTR